MITWYKCLHCGKMLRCMEMMEHFLRYAHTAYQTVNPECEICAES